MKVLIEEKRDASDRVSVVELSSTDPFSVSESVVSFQGDLQFNIHQDNDQSSLSLSQKQAIRNYLDAGVQSALIMCELLIKEHNASDKRFLTGKPDIYFDVCKYIESIESISIIQKDFEDRSYKVNI